LKDVRRESRCGAILVSFEEGSRPIDEDPHGRVQVTAADAQLLVRYGVDFSETAVRQYFDLAWATLSLADAILDEEVRMTIKLAEANLAEERRQEALTEAAAAVRLHEKILGRLIPTAHWCGEFD